MAGDFAPCVGVAGGRWYIVFGPLKASGGVSIDTGNHMLDLAGKAATKKSINITGNDK